MPTAGPHSRSSLPTTKKLAFDSCRLSSRYSTQTCSTGTTAQLPHVLGYAWRLSGEVVQGHHEEWMSGLLRNRPNLTRARLERTRDLMDKNAPDALVVGYERLISSLNLPDEKDRHVLAAAIQSKASLIVTNNLKDFPKESLQQFEVEAQSPNEFALNLLDLAPEDVSEAAEDHRLGLKNPPKTVAEYLITLESEGLVRTVAKPWLALL